MTNDNEPQTDGHAPEPLQSPPRPKAKVVWLLWLLPFAFLVAVAWYVIRGGLDRSHTFEEVTDIVVEPFDGK
jgi:cytochrome c-type biogenesis protein CcmH/NrfF